MTTNHSHSGSSQPSVGRGCHIKSAQKRFSKPIATEVKKLDAFYIAEDYYKRYYDKNPINPYCMLVIRPKVSKIRKEFSPIIKGKE